ncbi:MAG: cache domain-containing protein [Comamonadaceae bacterium]|nr:cache domain-containing protein [Comamonadaceae bacterium]
MHPYRTDLNGQDVSDFQDPRGVRIFVEFANVLRDQRRGLRRIRLAVEGRSGRASMPKQSYIKKFAPWGWILGTGLYIEDVQRGDPGHGRAGSSASPPASPSLCALLLLFVAAQSMRLERRAGQGRGRAARIAREVPDPGRVGRPKGR